MSYDNLNRVTNASVSSGPWATLQMGWGYDAFGNRTSQTLTGNPSAPAPQSQSWVYPANNQSSTSSYDVAGNVLNDGINQYAYDTEGRLCAVYSGATGDTIGYLYDAAGNRTAKGTIQAQLPLTAAACNLASNGFAPAESYVLNDSGQQVSEMDGSGNFLRSHVYANGGLLATYTNGATDFALNDWLGTKRVVADETGTAVGSCTSLPFGDELSCSGSASTSGHHFTGQVHDLESGNDFFPARYYGSNAGRFTNPDPGWFWAADPNNPQTWDQYAYAVNNPLVFTDPTGMQDEDCSSPATVSQTIDSNGNGDFVVTYDVRQNCNTPVPTSISPSSVLLQSYQHPAPYRLPVNANTNSSASLYKNTCIRNALLKGAGSTAIDAIGLIPEAEGFTRAFENEAGYQIARTVGNSAGYRGVVATQYGMKAVAQGKGAAAAISGAFGLGDTSVQGRISTGLTIAGFIPGLGQLAAGASMVNDAIKTGMTVGKCN